MAASIIRPIRITIIIITMVVYRRQIILVRQELVVEAAAAAEDLVANKAGAVNLVTIVNVAVSQVIAFRLGKILFGLFLLIFFLT